MDEIDDRQQQAEAEAAAAAAAAVKRKERIRMDEIDDRQQQAEAEQIAATATAAAAAEGRRQRVIVVLEKRDEFHWRTRNKIDELVEEFITILWLLCDSEVPDDDDDAAECRSQRVQLISVLKLHYTFPLFARNKIDIWVEEFLTRTIDNLHDMLCNVNVYDDAGIDGDLYYNGLDSNVDTEAEVETALRVFPEVLSRRGGRYNIYPIQYIAYYYSTVSFLPLVARLALEFGLFEKERGGLLLEDGKGDNILQYLVDGQFLDQSANDTILIVMIELRQMGYFKKEDIQKYGLVAISCKYREISERRFRFLVEWDPTSLIRTDGQTGLTTTTGLENAAAVDAVAVATTVDERCCDCDCDELWCHIISGRYSRQEKLQTLKKVYKGVATHAHGGDFFLKLFHTCGGISSVLTFLMKTMYDGNCVGANRMECIKYAALIIGNTTDPGENNVNEDIAKDFVTSIMECDGINPLIAASEEYSGGDDIPQLNALDSVWYALRNISCRMDEMEDLINKDQAIALFDTGINTISHLKSVDYPQASSTFEHIFSTLLNIENRYNMVTVTRADIRDASTATRTVAGIAGVADVAATTVSTAADPAYGKGTYGIEREVYSQKTMIQKELMLIEMLRRKHEMEDRKHQRDMEKEILTQK
jgi:hypothetical protein